MSLFQNTIVSKYLQTQSKDRVCKQWKIFQAHFHNPSVQENIRNSKEEQYQAGFIIDLFVNTLGYTKNPTPNFNITTEYKNIKDSKKADGAIIFNNTVKAVIELKGTNTTDLAKIETQAFGYKNNQPNCDYIVTSNFEKLRFYIDNAIEHIDFNLFTLTKDQFELLYLCLAKENIENDIPKKIKEQSLSEEDAITKNLYKDYSLFKRELHKNLVLLNPLYDALTLFKKSQKLLDRFLFLFFAEDRRLLPPNSVRLVLKQWEQLKGLDEDIPLYNRFKKYFGYLNTGFKGKQYNVYAYNGGLFKTDTILDTIVMDDDLLYKHTLKLSEYDFSSEVDVNILGHIFENSLTEIEGVQAELEGQKVDKTKAKRKKDGVFYTPKYITKYIVENTVGKLCEEKKLALQIDEADYITDKKRQKKTIKLFADKLSEYRDWLLQLTICDPACGSGAFLNQALDFLIREHGYIDELQAKLFGDAMVLSDVEKGILENNLFGVDLNEESIEIAKLSLWLRTAQPNRKLNDLSNNIKCGNSLIDDPEVAGNKAFNWQKEFPQIFKEIDQKIYHVTTAIHDSRTSNRMIEYKVRERRDMGTNPYPNIIYFTKEDDLLITQTIADIAKEDNLKILAYNICADHIHLLLVCDIDEIPNIMQKIKGRSSFVHNNMRIDKGLKPLVEDKKQKNKPLWQQKYSAPKGVKNQEQLHNTVNYIQNNRNKHGLLAHSKIIENIIDTMCCDIDTALKPKYIGGFDVVIGNPPYVQLQNMKEISLRIKELGYKTYESTGDLYCLFYEKGYDILKKKGLLGYITSSKWMRANYGKSLRKFFLENTFPYTLIELGSGILDSAIVDSNILFFKKEKRNTVKINSLDLVKSIRIDDFTIFNNQFVSIEPKKDNIWTIINPIEINIRKKIEVKGIPLKEWDVKINFGIKTGYNAAFLLDSDTKNKIIKEDAISSDLIKPLLRGRDIQRYYPEFAEQWLITTFPSLNINIDKYVGIKNYLKSFGKRLDQTGEKGSRKKTHNKWFETQDSISYYREFDNNLLIWKRIGSILRFSYGKYYCLDSTCILASNHNKYLLCIFNSKMGHYLMKDAPKTGTGDLLVSVQAVEPIKIPQISNELPFNEIADKMLDLNKDLQKISQKFQRALQRKFELEKLPKKLQNWYLLSFAEFIKELKKKKIKLTLSDEAEREDYFIREQQKALELKNKIDATDTEIDTMVYQLYGLTEDEIIIVNEASL